MTLQGSLGGREPYCSVNRAPERQIHIVGGGGIAVVNAIGTKLANLMGWWGLMVVVVVVAGIFML